jgi:hypothetical protein
MKTLSTYLSEKIFLYNGKERLTKDIFWGKIIMYHIRQDMICNEELKQVFCAFLKRNVKNYYYFIYEERNDEKKQRRKTAT